jgi:hypothetical protein
MRQTVSTRLTPVREVVSGNYVRLGTRWYAVEGPPTAVDQASHATFLWCTDTSGNLAQRLIHDPEVPVWAGVGAPHAWTSAVLARRARDLETQAAAALAEAGRVRRLARRQAGAGL